MSENKRTYSQKTNAALKCSQSQRKLITIMIHPVKTQFIIFNDMFWYKWPTSG